RPTASAPTQPSLPPLHDALPICAASSAPGPPPPAGRSGRGRSSAWGLTPPRRRLYPRRYSNVLPPTPAAAQSPAPGCAPPSGRRSEEHTSELQSRFDLVCRLLLE